MTPTKFKTKPIHGPIRPQYQGPRRDHTAHPQPQTEQRGRLRIIPLGGLEEIGKNMTAIEYERDIIIIDMGLSFPGEDMPGIDYVIPDVSYLKKNIQKIRGVVFTHGHLDHIGAVPYIVKEIGSPRLFGTRLTMELIKDRLVEFNLDRHVKISVIEPDDILRLGTFEVSFFRVNHNIPDGVGIAVKTPIGNLVFTGDFKFDHTPEDQKPTEFAKLAKLGGEGVLALFSDSTNANKPGYAIPEKTIADAMDTLFTKAKGRIIVTTFASLLSRIQQIINAAVAHNRKIAISGLSMEKNIEIAVRWGYLKFPRSSYIKSTQIKNFPPERVAIICTGSQGQETSALGRMAKEEHKHIKIQKGDTVILSSSPVPGNERAVQNLMDDLFSLGANVIYNKIFDIHISGHGYQEDLKLMMNLTRPKYFIPVHGARFQLVHHAQIAKDLGIKDENIFVMANGQILEMNAREARVSKTTVPMNYVLVDGLGIGDVGHVVLRDRKVMAEDGMFVVIVKIDHKTKALIGEPEIISRGFVYMKGAERLISETKNVVKKLVTDYKLNQVENWSPVRNKLRDDVGDFLYKHTERRPMILPVVIEV